MEVLQEGMIKLLEIVIGGALAIASVYATLFVTKATQKAKIEIAKLKDEQAKKLLNDSLDSVDVLLKTNIIANLCVHLLIQHMYYFSYLFCPPLLFFSPFYYSNHHPSYIYSDRKYWTEVKTTPAQQ